MVNKYGDDDDELYRNVHGNVRRLGWWAPESSFGRSMQFPHIMERLARFPHESATVHID